MKSTPIQTKSSWWPKLIIATFVFFALFIGNMVRQAMNSDVELVSKDYYKKELAFQQHINQVNAAQELREQIIITHAVAAEQISLVFPENTIPENTKGSIQFFRPSDPGLDFETPLKLNSDKQQHFRTTHLTKGLWRVKINWKTGKQAYYLQKDITI